MDQKTLDRVKEFVLSGENAGKTSGAESAEDYRHMPDARQLKKSGKLVDLCTCCQTLSLAGRPHEYVEAIYMCAGQTTHIVNGKTILLKQGQLLLMSQNAVHESFKPGKMDVEVNLIILPDFFANPLMMIGEEEMPLRRFLVNCLFDRNAEPGFLHFGTADDTAVQNLMENLLLCLTSAFQDTQRISQMTLTLLFMELADRTEMLITDAPEEEAIFKILQYIDNNYVSGSLSELAETLHYDISWLSREIKRRTGKTYTQILQEKRLAQAAFLLKTTDKNVDDISIAVGYENISYFHRIFYAEYGKSPKHFRDNG